MPPQHTTHTHYVFEVDVADAANVSILHKPWQSASQPVQPMQPRFQEPHGRLFGSASWQNLHMTDIEHQRRYTLLRDQGVFTDALDALRFRHWVADVMAMPRAERKVLSRKGAMVSLLGEPVHWIDAVTGVGYWDPGNAVYARALHLALLYRPTSFDMPWNEETCGDIVECTFAMAWIMPESNYFEDLRQALEDMVRATIALLDDLPWVQRCSPQEWADDVDDLRIEYARRGWDDFYG